MLFILFPDTRGSKPPLYLIYMNNHSDAGYEEIEHTADWQLNVWAPTLEGLFIQAAQGMYSLAHIRHDETEQIEKQLNLQEADHEILLVSFLTELLYFASAENLAFEVDEIQLRDTQLSARLVGGQITRHDKEIKAVTYHALDIARLDDLYRVSIVFDV